MPPTTARLDYDRVKAWADAHLEALVHDYGGTEVKRHRARCPIHGGDNPQAFALTPSKGLWYCHACGVGGDAVDFVRLLRFPGLPDKEGRVEALRELAPKAGVFADERPGPQRARRPVAPRTAPKPPHPSAPEPLGTPEDRALRAAVYGRVREVLTLTERGRAYLTGRGLPWAVAEADGFRSLDTLAAWRQLYRTLRQDFPEATLRLAGLWESPPWQGRAPALVLPYTYRGAVVGLRFRRMDGGLPKYQSLRGLPLPMPFQADALDALDGHTLHLCEGELDAFTLRGAMPAGARVIGIPGATSWKDAWTPLLRPAGRVVVWFDADRGGEAGARTFGEKLQAHLGSAWLARVRWRRVPEGEDINALWQKGLLTGDYLTD
jgi:DNA primase